MSRELAIVTGGTSGIGKEYSNRLAKLGYDLLIVGRREEILERNANEIRENFNVEVEVVSLDLRNDLDVDKFVEIVEEKNNIGFLVNNAGYGAENSFIKDSYENQEDMLKVHNRIVIKLCHTVGNKMKIRKKGVIVNVSSLAAFNEFAESAMYCSTKRFLVTFSECLGMELMRDNVKVQCLCPGFTRTDFHNKLKMDEKDLQNKGVVRWGSTYDVVDYSLKMLKKKYSIIVIPGILNRFLYRVVKLIPKCIYYRVVTKGWGLMKR